MKPECTRDCVWEVCVMEGQVWRKFHGVSRQHEDRVATGTEKENEAFGI